MLLSLYKLNPIKKIIERIRPILPTHADIITFVEKFWPDILLMEPADDLDSEEREWDGDGVWGSPNSGAVAVPRAEVKIIMPLVTQWIESVSLLYTGLTNSNRTEKVARCTCITFSKCPLLVHKFSHSP